MLVLQPGIVPGCGAQLSFLSCFLGALHRTQALEAGSKGLPPG